MKRLTTTLGGNATQCQKTAAASTGAADTLNQNNLVWRGVGPETHVIWAERVGPDVWDLTRPGAKMRLYLAVTSMTTSATRAWDNHSQPVVLLCGADGRIMRLVHVESQLLVNQQSGEVLNKFMPAKESGDGLRLLSRLVRWHGQRSRDAVGRRRLAPPGVSQAGEARGDPHPARRRQRRLRPEPQQLGLPSVGIQSASKIARDCKETLHGSVPKMGHGGNLRLPASLQPLAQRIDADSSISSDRANDGRVRLSEVQRGASLGRFAADELGTADALARALSLSGRGLTPSRPTTPTAPSTPFTPWPSTPSTSNSERVTALTGKKLSSQPLEVPGLDPSRPVAYVTATTSDGSAVKVTVGREAQRNRADGSSANWGFTQPTAGPVFPVRHRHAEGRHGSLRGRRGAGLLGLLLHPGGQGRHQGTAARWSCPSRWLGRGWRSRTSTSRSTRRCGSGTRNRSARRSRPT